MNNENLIVIFKVCLRSLNSKYACCPALPSCLSLCCVCLLLCFFPCLLPVSVTCCLLPSPSCRAPSCGVKQFNPCLLVWSLLTNVLTNKSNFLNFQVYKFMGMPPKLALREHRPSDGSETQKPNLLDDEDLILKKMKRCSWRWDRGYLLKEGSCFSGFVEGNLDSRLKYLLNHS